MPVRRRAVRCAGQSDVRGSRALGRSGTPGGGPVAGYRAPPLPGAALASRQRPVRGLVAVAMPGGRLGAGESREGPGNPREGHDVPRAVPGALAPPRTGGLTPNRRKAPLCQSPHGLTVEAPSFVPVRIPPTGSGRAFLGSACCWGMCHCGLPGPVRTGGPLKAPRCTCPGNALRGCPPRHPRCQKRPPRRFWHRLLRLTSFLDGYVERAVIYVSCICPSTCARAPLWRSGLKRKDVAWGL